MPTIAPPIVVPFTLRLDHIFLDLHINGTPATLVLDTGSGACVLDTDWAAQLSLTSARTGKALGTDSVSISLVTIDSLRIGDEVDLKSEMAALVSLSGVSEASGVPIHGTIGFPFFAKYVVEIDYQACVLRLYDPDTFAYEGPAEGIPIDVSMRVPVLDAAVVAGDGTPIPARLVLDLGTEAYGSILTRPFVAKHRGAIDAIPFIQRQLGTGVGGAMDGRVARLAELRVGSLRVPKPVVGLPAEARGYFGATWADGTLGAPILRRTRLTLDYAHKQVFMEPVRPLDEPFPFDLSGLTLSAVAPALETVTIEAVAPNSAAATAGIVAGETLRAIDGQLATGASLDVVTTLLQQPASTHTLRVAREGRERDVDLRLGHDFGL
jgi:Aspartyl protease/PDZ domain